MDGVDPKDIEVPTFTNLVLNPKFNVIKCVMLDEGRAIVFVSDACKSTLMA
jgi:hypothetical protein